MNKLMERDNLGDLKDEKGRYYYFDNLKFVLIFFVVLGHFLDPITKTSNYARCIWLFISFFHMPLFIYLSGYFAKNSIKKRNINRPIIFFFLYIILCFCIYITGKFIYNKKAALSLFTVKGIPWYLLAMSIWYLFSMKTDRCNKKILMIFTIIIALIIGYDKNFGDFFALSRIIVFYPFFLLGTITEEDKIMKYINNNKIKIVSVILLIIICICFCFFINKIYFIRPLTTARNSYFSLNNEYLGEHTEKYGILFRAMWYIISSILSGLIMVLIPKRKNIFSKFGQRTLAVYFLHAIVLEIWSYQNIKLHVYQYIIISVIVTIILSLKVFSIPFEKMMKLKLVDKNVKID